MSDSVSEHSGLILLVEDDTSMRRALVLELSDLGFRVVDTPRADDGFELFQSHVFNLVISDLRLVSGEEGIDLLRKCKHFSPFTPMMIITAYGSIESAVRAMNAGADDFITKGFTIEELVMRMEKLFEKRDLSLQCQRLGTDNVRLRRFIEHVLPAPPLLIGESPEMTSLKEQIAGAARTAMPVLITGETGVGKELVAAAIHRSSRRQSQPFVVVNCAAIPETLFESELFGYEKGAFTGADSRKIGLFEVAHRGVLFLDEIGEMSLSIQPKLLRALENGTFLRLGGTTPVSVDVQIIAATNRDIVADVAEKKFREDLFYRLNVLPLHVPPLREHRRDIPLLVEHFLAEHARETRHMVLCMADEAVELLQAHDWPGNIRELKNIVERVACLVDSPEISAADVHDIWPGVSRSLDRYEHDEDIAQRDPVTLKLYVEEMERAQKAILVRAMEQTTSLRQAATLLGLSRRSVRRMLDKYGLGQ